MSQRRKFPLQSYAESISRSSNRLKSDRYTLIRYDNVPEMVTPSDNRDFNYHISNINTISQRISGLFDFIGNAKSSSKISSEIYQYMNEKANGEINIDSVATQQEYKFNSQKSINFENGQLLNKENFDHSKSKRILEQSRKSLKSESIKKDTPQKNKHVQSRILSPIRKLQLQVSMKRLDTSQSTEKNKKKYSYLNKIEEDQPNNQKYQQYGKSSQRSVKASKFVSGFMMDSQKSIENQRQTSSEKGLRNSRGNQHQQLGAEIQKGPPMIYTVREQSENYYSGAGTSKREEQSPQKNYKKEFRYIDDEENMNDIQKNRSYSFNGPIEQMRSLRNSLAAEQIEQPQPPGPIQSRSQLFELRLFPCDLTDENINNYIADKLFILGLIDEVINMQRNQILTRAHKQFTSKHINNDEKAFTNALYKFQLPIICHLQKIAKQKGLIEEGKSLTLFKQFLDYQYIDYQSFSQSQQLGGSIEEKVLLESFLQNFMMGQKYWNNKLKQILTFNQLDNTKFDPELIDLEGKGYLKVQDFTCLINMHSSSMETIQKTSGDYWPKMLGFELAKQKKNKRFKNKQLMPLFNRFTKRMKIYYSNSYFGPIKSSQVINNSGISYQCFMDKLL